MYDVIIVGGSYAGLSAAMALGRSLRKVLVLDNGQPCNRQTPHSHNFLLQDGETPAAITALAKEKVHQYPTINFLSSTVVGGKQISTGFEINTAEGQSFTAKKVLIATGVKDVLPAIPGFAECWGISVLHCLYCHGYEVKNTPTAVLANGDIGFEYAKMIRHWTKDLTLITNGKSTLTEEQITRLQAKGIAILEKEIKAIDHSDDNLHRLVFTDGSQLNITVLYTRPAMEQHTQLPTQLGCKLTEQGYIEVDDFKKTSVKGIYAAGDATTMFRSVAAAIGAGNLAGAMINKELIDDEWS